MDSKNKKKNWQTIYSAPKIRRTIVMNSQEFSLKVCKLESDIGAIIKEDEFKLEFLDEPMVEACRFVNRKYSVLIIMNEKMKLFLEETYNTRTSFSYFRELHILIQSLQHSYPNPNLSFKVLQDYSPMSIVFFYFTEKGIPTILYQFPNEQEIKEAGFTNSSLEEHRFA